MEPAGQGEGLLLLENDHLLEHVIHRLEHLHVVAHREETLGRHHDAVPRQIAQRHAERAFALPAVVDVRGVKQVDAAVERLLAYVDELFQGEMAQTTGVSIDRVEAIHLGSYRQWRKPKVVKVLEGRDRYTATLFGLVIDKNPLEVMRDPLELDPDERYRVKPYRADLARPFVTHLLHVQQFADIPVDDVSEMARSGMPPAFAEALGSMSTETREVYQTNLRDIHDRPASLRKIKPKRFMKVLATYGTYASPAGDYFAKWQPGEVGSRDVVSAYTDEMLDRWSLRYDVAMDHPRREWIRTRLRRARRARWGR